MFKNPVGNKIPMFSKFGAMEQNSVNRIPIMIVVPLFRNVESMITNKRLMITVDIVPKKLIIIYCTSFGIAGKKEPDASGCFIIYT